MKQLTRIIALLLALTGIVSMLGACGKEEKLPETKPPRTTQAPTQAPVVWPDLADVSYNNDLLIGRWPGENAELEFDGVESFWHYTAEGPVLEGEYLLDDTTLYLRDEKGTVLRGSLKGPDTLVLESCPAPFHSPWVSFLDIIVGTWTYQFADLTLNFAPDGTYTWQHYGTGGEGTYLFNGQELILEPEDTNSEIGCIDYENSLHLESLMGFFYAEGGAPYYPLEEDQQARLAPRYQPATERIPLHNAVALANENTGYYQRMDADWCVAQTELTPVNPSNKACAVVGACFMPYRNQPDFQGTVEAHSDFVLYDRYTGMILRSNEAEELEENYYRFVFDSRDGRVELYVSVEKKNEGPIGDCFCIMTVSLNLEMPEWYDGLVFAAMDTPDNLDQMVLEAQEDLPLYRSNMLLYPEDRLESSLTFAIG